MGIYLFRILRDRSVDRENKCRAERYRAVMSQNGQIMVNNRRIQSKIEEIHSRKAMISNEFTQQVCPWFPKEYCYLEAVDFLIHELEFGIATNLSEAIKSYREYLYHKELTGKLDMLNDKLSVVINNQQVMISRQEELIRQQMIGNFLTCATLQEVGNIRRSVSGMGSSMSNMESKVNDIYNKMR